MGPARVSGSAQLRRVVGRCSAAQAGMGAPAGRDYYLLRTVVPVRGRHHEAVTVGVGSGGSRADPLAYGHGEAAPRRLTAPPDTVGYGRSDCAVRQVSPALLQTTLSSGSECATATNALSPQHLPESDLLCLRQFVSDAGVSPGAATDRTPNRVGKSQMNNRTHRRSSLCLPCKTHPQVCSSADLDICRRG